MPRLQSLDIDPVDVDADGIAAAQTPAAGGEQNLTLGGALASGGTYTSGDGGARQISVTAAADDNARTLTITGTDADGRAQTESFTGAELNTTTTESAKYWNTVTQATVDADTAGDLSIGIVDELVSKTIKLNRHSTTGALVVFDVTGTINADIEILAADPNSYDAQDTMPWVDTSTSGLVGATGDIAGSLEPHVVACRVVINSYSSGAEIQAYISQGYK